MLLKKNEIDTIAIGGFDGIHRGHWQLINQLGNHGALVIIDKDNANLTPKSKRTEYSKYPCMFYHFDKVKSLKGEEFLQILKKDFPNLKKIVVGYDFAFGVKRSCNTNDLKRMFDGEVLVIKEYFYDGISVHSTYIREKISQANIYCANRLLGREYAINGTIVKGQGLGAKKLYATLNLKVYDFLLPKDGVYATRTRIKDEFFNSISFVGYRLSVDNEFSIETHIIDKNEIPPCTWVELIFVDFIRENKKFDTLDSLKEQIAQDIKIARKSLLTCKVEYEDKSK